MTTYRRKRKPSHISLLENISTPQLMNHFFHSPANQNNIKVRSAMASTYNHNLMMFAYIASAFILLLDISIISAQNQYQAPRSSRSFIAPSLPQIIPSSHVSYQDGRRSYQTNQDSGNDNDKLTSQQTLVSSAVSGGITKINNDDAFRYKRTPLISSPISSLLPSIVNAASQEKPQGDNYYSYHHRYGWHGQASPGDSSGGGGGDLLMSSSSLVENQQLDNSPVPYRTLQHRSSPALDSGVLGRSARLNYNANVNAEQQKEKDQELESERLRQRQYIQYHDQWPSMAGKCHKRTLNFCARVLPFNTTIFPNIMGDTNRFEVKRSLPFFGFLAKSNCNKRLDQLLCLLLEPPCQIETSKAIPPCKKFCRVALEGCGEYIPATLAMSSVFDCRKYPDSNDPNVCINLAQGNTCADDEFKCPDKTCIPRHWLCDGVRDCIFAADEANCTASSDNQEIQSVCSTEEFKCDGKCVPKSWKCDRERDCLDGSDEESCDAKPQCGPDRFKCADGNGCIPKRWVCDGKAECRDGSDEQQCNLKECSENDFKCDNGICVPKIWRCDRQLDCKDGSDEFNCFYPSSTTTTTTTIPTVVSLRQQTNKTIVLTDIETLGSSNVSLETVGGQDGQNNDGHSNNLSSSSQKTHHPAVDSEITTIDSNYTDSSVALIDQDDIIRLYGANSSQQQISTSATPVAELVASSTSVSGISGSSSGIDESSSQQKAMIDSNDAKTSYVVDDAKQDSDIRIDNMQPHNKQQQRHQPMKLARLQQQLQKKISPISTEYNNQPHHRQLPASSYAPSVIINNNKQTNEVIGADSSPSTLSHSTPPMPNSNNLAAVDSLANDDHQQPPSMSSSNQHLNQQQHHKNYHPQQLLHPQQAQRLFSSFNKYTGPTQHQSRIFKLHHNKIPIYRSLINTLTGNHYFHLPQLPTLNGQPPMDTSAPMASYRQKRDRLMPVMQTSPSTMAAIQSYPTSISPYPSPSGSGVQVGASSASTSSTASIPPFPNSQSSRGASYFQLLSRYNLAGHRSPKIIPAVEVQQHLHQMQNSQPLPRNPYFHRNGPTSDALVH